MRVVSVWAAEIADLEVGQVSKAVRKVEPAHECDRGRRKCSKREGERAIRMKQTYKSVEAKATSAKRVSKSMRWREMGKV
jgi:hypothetical protein